MDQALADSLNQLSQVLSGLQQGQYLQQQQFQQFSQQSQSNSGPPKTVWQKNNLTIGGRQVLSQFAFPFAAKVLRPWELDKILDCSIQEDVDFPILAVDPVLAFPTCVEELYHAPANPCQRLARTSALAEVFEPFHDQAFVQLKARPGKLDKEFAVLFSAVSFQWDICLLLLQVVLHPDIAQTPNIQVALILALSQLVKCTRFLNKRRECLVYYDSSSRDQGEYIDLELERGAKDQDPDLESAVKKFQEIKLAAAKQQLRQDAKVITPIKPRPANGNGAKRAAAKEREKREREQ